MNLNSGLSDVALISQLNNSSQNNIRWQLDPKDVLDEIELQLRGLEFREKKGLVRFRTPYMNDEGIGSVKILIRAHLTASNALSVLEKKEMMSIALGCAHLINDELFLKGFKWGVNLEDVAFINNIVEDSIYIFLTRAVDGGERERLTRTYSYSDGIQRKRSMRSLFSPRGGNNWIDDGY